MFALNKLRPYLLGSEFICYTDHKPLLSLFTKEMNNTKIQRWGILFSEFKADIRYRPGPNNVRADMLSRIEAGTEVASLAYTLSRIETACELAVIDMSTEWVDLDTHKIATEPILHDNLDKETLIRDQEKEFPDLLTAAGEPDSGSFLHSGILYSGSRTNKYEPRYPRIVLPSTFRTQILERCHKESGHSSTLKTMLKV